MAFVFKRNLALTVFSHAILKLKCSFFVAIRFCVAQTFFEHSRLYFQPAHSSDSKFEPAKLFFMDMENKFDFYADQPDRDLHLLMFFKLFYIQM